MKKTKPARGASFPNTRKALRKQKRREKKVHRQEHYMKKKTVQDQPKYTPGRFVKRPAEDPDPQEEPKHKKQKPQTSSQDILTHQRQKEKKEVARLNSQMEEQRRKIFLKANEDEDKMIKKLEKQLGLNKAKNKNNYFADDGLDYLLEICDRATSEQIVAAEKHLADVENDLDFEEDLATVTGKEINKSKQEHEKPNKNSKKQVKNTKDSDSESENDNVDNELSGEEEESMVDDMNEEELEINEHSNDELESGEEESELDGQATESDDISSDSSDEPEEKPSKPTNPEPKIEVKDTRKTLEKKSSKERIVKAEDLNKVFSDDEVSHLSDDDDDSEGFFGEENGEDKEVGEEEKKSKEKPEVWEDIYGRKRDKEGNVIKEQKGIYIPPHLRNKDSITDKDLVQLKRQIKSVLNKLAGTNLHWACTSIENLYSANSRNSVNTALSQLWLEATVAPSMTPDRMVAEHAALVAVLHANVGSEIGAHFLQELTKRFDNLLQSSQPVGDKTLDNLVACLAHLYSFKIYHATLLYDLLSRLTEVLSEKHIECVLVALRCVGGVMRKEEPLMLKNFIHDTQQKVAGITETACEGSRIKFLLEVLMAVKNNNLNKIPNYEPTYSEHLKKTIRSVIRKGNYVTPLNIRLEDLLKADERGKWWVVGSAWEGARPQEERPVKVVPSADQRLLELARKQRMNTDVRRSVFCIIMAAEDYMSAFEKLEQLGLRGPQQREIAHVVLACCLQEKKYNPYYAVLATKFTDTDRKYQLSFQFSIWDKIKDIDNLSKQAMTNLSQFLVHLVMEKGLALSVLKIIQFSDLTKRTVQFMRQTLLTVIMNEDLQSTLDAFHRIAKSPKLHMFRESLRLFIQHFLIKNAEKRNQVLSEKEMVILKERAESIDKILTLHDSKVMF